MKALKCVLIAVVVALAMTGYAKSSDPVKSEEIRVVKVYLEQALTNPELVCTMYQQLTPDFLYQTENSGLYSARVRYMFKVVEIYGGRDAWIDFFRSAPGWAPIE